MHDGHAHGHAHHGHGHQRLDARSLSRAFGFGIALNLAFIAVEAVSGVVSHSTALLADAAHNLSDVLGLVLAWAASVLARRRPTQRHTYGFRSSTVLAALANAVLLFATVAAVGWQAISRLRSPAEVQSLTMMAVAAIGVVINGASALPFLRGRRHDHNVRGAFLHLAADAAISAGVVIAGAVIWKTGWYWIDPAVSLAVSLTILVATWSLLRDSLHLALDGVPERIDLQAVRHYLASLPDVQEVHDLHVWAMSTTEVALTTHLVMPWPERPPQFLAALERDLAAAFRIDHVTVQIDPCEAPGCRFAAPGSDCVSPRS